jgi:hypothetical protein
MMAKPGPPEPALMEGTTEDSGAYWEVILSLPGETIAYSLLGRRKSIPGKNLASHDGDSMVSNPLSRRIAAETILMQKTLILALSDELL